MKYNYYSKVFFIVTIICFYGTANAINTNVKQAQLSSPKNNYVLMLGACPPCSLHI